MLFCVDVAQKRPMRSQDSDDLEEEGEVKVVVKQRPGRPYAPLPVPARERTGVRFVRKVAQREPGEIIRSEAAQELEPGEIPQQQIQTGIVLGI